MSTQTDTKTRILAAAKAEFLEYGYEDASLRRICKQANTSTGSLYFFFQGKAELYTFLVKEVEHKIFDLLDVAERQIKTYLTLQRKSGKPCKTIADMDEMLFKSVFLSFFESFIQNKDASVLLLQSGKSPSNARSFLDQVVDRSVQVFWPLVDFVKEAGHLDDTFSPLTLRMILRSMYAALASLLMSELTYSEAMEHLELMLTCFLASLQLISERYDPHKYTNNVFGKDSLS